MKKFLLVVLVLLVALGLAWWSLPAETVWQRVSAQVPMVRLQGVTGRVWSGQAEGVSVRAIPLGAARWQFSPIAGLGGKADGRIELSGGPAQMSAALVASRTDVALANVQATLPAKMLEPALDIPALRLLGSIRVEAPSVVLKEGVLQSAQGFLEWQDLGVSGLAEARLGGLRVDFAPEGSVVVGRVRDLGGPLAVDGIIRVQGQVFNAEINLDARDPSVAEALLYIGERKPNGGSLLRIDGAIEKLW